ncbi:MAG: hypothetical protein K9K82_10040 [Desulfobacteraceae bacterium]|nr:hypothetical protein [Desulfobacteraceae bacterium]
MIEKRIKSIALEEGAVSAGIALHDVFSEAPSSADMRSLKPWANSVVSFAVPLGKEWIEDFLGKKTRLEFKKRVYYTYHEVYRIGHVIEKYLKDLGYRAYNVIPNGIYRSDHTFEKPVPDSDIKPPLSLRYLAVGAGVGSFGWSGNVMVPGEMSNVYLGGILTDAGFTPDEIMEETLCDDCRICAQVCPAEFINKREKTSVIIGGKRHVYNKKRGDLRCVISCGGYTGLSKNGKWSSWSTGRCILPEDDRLLPETYVQLRDDPANAMASRNLTFGTWGVIDRSLENTNPTCNHCITVCSGPLERRKYLRDLLFASGIVQQNENGKEIVVKPDK